LSSTKGEKEKNAVSFVLQGNLEYHVTTELPFLNCSTLPRKDIRQSPSAGGGPRGAGSLLFNWENREGGVFHKVRYLGEPRDALRESWKGGKKKGRNLRLERGSEAPEGYLSTTLKKKSNRKDLRRGEGGGKGNSFRGKDVSAEKRFRKQQSAFRRTGGKGEEKRQSVGHHRKGEETNSRRFFFRGKKRKSRVYQTTGVGRRRGGLLLSRHGEGRKRFEESSQEKGDRSSPKEGDYFGEESLSGEEKTLPERGVHPLLRGASKRTGILKEKEKRDSFQGSTTL